jgi:hypothetical protein
MDDTFTDDDGTVWTKATPDQIDAFFAKLQLEAASQDRQAARDPNFQQAWTMRDGVPTCLNVTVNIAPLPEIS